MTSAEFISHLRGVRPTTAGWDARCPAHEDTHASLSIGTGEDGRVLVNCHTGCSTESVVQALGLRMSDLMPSTVKVGPEGRRVVAHYDYQDETGRPLYRSVRYQPKDFRQCQPDGHGGWIWNLDGVSRRVVYGLNALHDKRPPAVFVVEGEKDVHAIEELGLPATTNIGGASKSTDPAKSKWRQEYTDQLVACGVERVYILPDNDAAGRAHATAAAASCHAAGIVARVVSLPGVPEKGDASDWLAMGGQKAALLELAKSAPLWQPSGTAPTGANSPQARVIDRAAWPRPIQSVGYIGVLGDVVKALEPHTEADPAGLLLQLLAMLGNAIGRTAHFRVESDVHYLNLFVLMVGASARGRKGVSSGRARELLHAADPVWADRCLKSGLSSGEGLIWAVRDPIEKQTPIKDKGRVLGYETVIDDPGVEDKRLLVSESELASVLRVMAREGNTLSAIMRQAWDGLPLSSLTKNSPAKATGAHISVIAQITRDELRRYLGATEMANGWGNRFLLVCVDRSKMLPDGGGAVDLQPFRAQLQHVVAHARAVGSMPRDPEASALWHREYARLSSGLPGLLGSMTARAEAQTMRLACLYALASMSSVVRVEHLRAALETWRYCFGSARYIFGDAVGDPLADDLLRALRSEPDGLIRSDLHAACGRNRSGSDITRALHILEAARLAQMTPEPTEGRTAERWHATPEDYELNEESSSGAPLLSSNSFNSCAPLPPEEGQTDAFGAID